MDTLPMNVDFLSRRCVWVNGPVIIGAGPSGLTVAAGLRDQGVPFVILDRADCIASLWQNRTYDRLKLHLPKKFCQLPGLPFPDHYPEYPTRYQFVDYLESYASKYAITPHFNECVRTAKYDQTSGLWRVRTASALTGGVATEVEYICQSVVVATGENAENVVPEFEGLGNFAGKVVHVSDYKSGEKFRGQNVLVVGCGNSGMEVSLDLCNYGASPSMVVRDAVHVLPREVLGKSTFELAVLLMAWLPLWFVDKLLVFLAWLVLGNLERYGIMRPAVGPMELKNKEGKTPVLDIGALAKIRSGECQIVPGIKSFGKNGVELVDGRFLAIDAVVLATGYRSNVPQWLQETDFFGKNGYPKQSFPNGWKGERGLYAAGFTRRGIAGLSRDAKKVAQDIARVWKEDAKPAKKVTACHRRCISVF